MNYQQNYSPYRRLHNSLQCFVILFSLLWAMTPLHAATLTLTQQQSLGIHTAPPIQDDVSSAQAVIAQVKLAPNALMHLAKPYALQVRQLHVKVGDFVQQNMPLAVIYIPELQQLEHQFHNSLTTLKLATQKNQRDAQLYRDGIIAKKQYEASHTEYLQAQENKVALLTQLSRMGLSASEMALLEDPSNQHLEGEIVLRAPIDGRIQDVKVTQGDSLSANQTLISLLAHNQLMVDIPLNLTQAANLSVGQTLMTSEHIPLHITTIQNNLSLAQKVTVSASIANESHYKPGQRIYVQLTTSEDMQSLWRLPRQAIIYLDNQPHIFVVNQGELQAQGVTLIRATREGWVIANNQLSATSAVVVSGTAAAKSVWQQAEESTP